MFLKSDAKIIQKSESGRVTLRFLTKTAISALKRLFGQVVSDVAAEQFQLVREEKTLFVDGQFMLFLPSYFVLDALSEIDGIEVVPLALFVPTED